MVTSNPCLAFYCILPSWLIQCMWDYSNLIHSYISNNNHPMTTSNLVLYLQHVVWKSDMVVIGGNILEGNVFHGYATM